MAAGHPGLGVHEDGGVQTHVIGVLLDELLPPGFLDVVLELHAQGAVVPGVGKAAVDLTACEDKAAALAKGYDLLHGFLLVIHVRFSFFTQTILTGQNKNAPSRNRLRANFTKSPWFHLNFPMGDTLPGNGGDRRGISAPRLQGAFSPFPPGLSPAVLSLFREMEGILLPVTAFHGYREELYHVFTALSRERPGSPFSR